MRKKFTVADIKKHCSKNQSIVIRKCGLITSVEVYEGFDTRDCLVMTANHDFDNGQEFVWSVNSQELAVLCMLPAKAELEFHIRDNRNEVNKEDQYFVDQLMVRVTTYKRSNPDRLDKMIDVLIDTQCIPTSVFNATNRNVKSY